MPSDKSFIRLEFSKNKTTSEQVLNIYGNTSKKQEILNLQQDSYMAVSILISTGTTVNNLELTPQLENGNVATEIIPHQEQNTIFPLVEGQVLHEGDYLAEDGIHQVRKQIRVDVSIFTSLATANGLLILSSAGAGIIWDYKNISGVCSHFINANNENITANGSAENTLLDGQYNFRAGSSKDRIYFKNSLFATMEDWRNFFNNNEVFLEYEAEEIVIPYTEEQKEAYYQLQHLLMYEGYTTIECIDEIKPDIQVEYSYNNEINTTYGKKIDTLEARIRQLEKMITSQSEVSS